MNCYFYLSIIFSFVSICFHLDWHDLIKINIAKIKCIKDIRLILYVSICENEQDIFFINKFNKIKGSIIEIAYNYYTIFYFEYFER